MLESLRISNFRCHVDTTVRFGRLTALVGPNGAGKSTVLEALRTVPGASTATGTALPWLEAPYRWPGADEAQMHAIDAPPGSGPQAVTWRLFDSNGPAMSLLTRASDEMVGDKVHREVSRLHLSEALSLDVVPARVGRPALLTDPSAKFAEDGSNTAAVLAAIKIVDESMFQRVDAALQAVVPSITKLHVAPASVPGERAVGWEVRVDLRGAGRLPAAALSQGTRMTLALVTALCHPSAPQLVMFDEIDHALHPRAQLELLRQVRALLGVFPTMQVVFTTHSPYMLDALTPDEVQVFALHADGSSRVRSLAEYPGAEKARGALSAGELWSLSDEAEWVLAP